ncbi:hypothetical protein [Emticicia sp. BO119]|uniref:hypothetical protein n=1 Tax=Emticicia sp. BO119 TaxID=2757768 RepID=UPI0015F01584|nr:hypothetical protein [Emticicia sp. BO119]MBA4851366.1 hypothetical protein [Emticicia sp. BO119]
MMKTDNISKKPSDTILYSYLICTCFATCSYFAFEGKYFEWSVQVAVIAFLFICTLTAIRTSSIDNFYLPPVEIPVSNKRWEKCIAWWNSLSDDELLINIRKLKTMNKKNADTLLKAFEQSELFEKCSIIKREIS